MSNPFDVFAADFRAAVPTTENKENSTTSTDVSNINIMAQPAPSPVPVMNTMAPSPVPMVGGAMNALPPSPTMNGTTPVAPPQLSGNMNGFSLSQVASHTVYPLPTTQIDTGAVVSSNGPSPLPEGPPPLVGGCTMVSSTTPSNAYVNIPSDTHLSFGATSMSMYGVLPTDTKDNTRPQQPPITSNANVGGIGVAYGVNPVVPTTVPPPFVPSDICGAPPQRQNPPHQSFLSGLPPPVVASESATAIAVSVSEQVPVVPPSQPMASTTTPFDSFDPVAAVCNNALSPTDPWGQTQATSLNETSEAVSLVPSSNHAADDPFGIFGVPSTVSLTAPVCPTNTDQRLTSADSDDPWSELGFGPSSAAFAPSKSVSSPSTPGPETSSLKVNTAGVAAEASLLTGENTVSPAPQSTATARKDGDLPPGGEWYDARIFTPTLGVMFFKPAELTDSLFLQTDRLLVDALDDRPVVAFIVEGSSARSAGVELGHVLLKVNGIDVKNPKEASRLIKEGPRPLPLLFYVPDTAVVVAEGEHMVKYDTRDTGAPNSAKDWKSKYVVIGGIISQPWMMNMYRSKSEYDIAVIETQARRPVSVKVKQFSLQGARIQNDWQGPQMVKYKNKLHPWKYIVVLPVSRNPIKISSPNLGQLKPVHEGIRRVLMAQQRHAPAASAAVPSRSGDAYARTSGVHDDECDSGYEGSGGICSARRRHEY